MAQPADQLMVTIAPQIIYKQFCDLAKRRQWSEVYLGEQIRGEVDNPTDVIRTIMRGALMRSFMASTTPLSPTGR